MPSDNELDKLIKIIFPQWKKEFEIFIDGDENKREYFLEKFKIIFKYIDKPDKLHPIGLFKQIKEEKDKIFDSLQKRLSKTDVVKFYKSEIPDKDKNFLRAIEMIKSCAKTPTLTSDDSKHLISEYAKKLENIDNLYKLVKLKFDLDGIIPYEVKSLRFRDYEESDKLGSSIIRWSPLMTSRYDITEKTDTFISMTAEHCWKDISESYQDLIALEDISDIMRRYLVRYFQPTKWALNKSNVYLCLIISLWILWVIGFSLKYIIIIPLRVLFVIILREIFLKKD